MSLASYLEGLMRTLELTREFRDKAKQLAAKVLYRDTAARAVLLAALTVIRSAL